MSKHDYMIVSFYTKGTGYAKDALKLIQSLEKFALPHWIEPVPNLRSWQKNTHFKAKFIKQMLEKFTGMNIVWLDCDAVVHKEPEMFDTIDADFGCHFRTWKARVNELLTGTLFIRNNQKMANIVDAWIMMNKKRPDYLEQRNLERIIRRDGFLINVCSLPIEYCCIFDDENRHRINPVIEHFQASRKYRREVERRK